MPTQTCAECGKKFIAPDPDSWAYKKPTGKYMKVKLFCSWTCFRKGEKKRVVK